jgi:serine protease Do
MNILSRPLALRAGTLAVSLALLAGLWQVGQPLSSAHALPASQAALAAPAANPRSLPLPAAALPDFSALVEQNGPAVVNIQVTQRAQAAQPRPEDYGPFGEFLRRFGGQVPGGNAPARGQGSGFIVDPNGVILTNAHVVDKAAEVLVRVSNGSGPEKEYKARVVGVDKRTDIAVLRIEAKGLPVVRIGDPAQTRTGEWVVAIGSPFGFENSVTAGIISAKSRALPDEAYVPFIQTDAAVNPGNSGGPLFNLRGEVIGINSQIYSRSGGYQGLAFAIPIDVAVKVKDELLASGRVSRGRLGVSAQELNAQLAQSFGLEQPVGALVSAIEPGGPAAKAGVQPGDIILRLNDTAILRSSELPRAVAALKPGSQARLDVLREGKRRTLAFTVGEISEPVAAAPAAVADPATAGGLAVRPLSARERQASGLDAGLLVEQSAGAAAEAGIAPGDVILAVNGTSVQSVEQLRALVGKRKSAALLVQREGGRLFVPLTLG